MAKKIDTYIHRVAGKMVVRVHAHLSAYDEYSPRVVARAFYNDYASLIRGELLQMSPEVRAKIAALGKGEGSSYESLSLENVHLRSNWLNGSLSGEAIITEVATTALVAAIYDLIMEDRAKRKFQPTIGSSYIGGGTSLARKAWLPSLDDYDRW